MTLDLQRSDSPDALDVFKYLTRLTHHNTFQSKMIYQSELIGIQRRLNKVLLPHGYKLKSKQVPLGIQRAHKVSANEKRWGFEKLSKAEQRKHGSRKSPIEMILTQIRRERANELKLQKAERLSPIFAEIMKNHELINEQQPIAISDEQLKGLFDLPDIEVPDIDVSNIEVPDIEI